MGFVEATRTCLAKYATFSGRASRSEFWFFALFNGLVGLFRDIIVTAAPDSARISAAVILLVMLLPNIAVGVRRRHEIDRTGWWLLLELVPVIGWIVLLVWACMRGTIGPNRYGPDPLAGASDASGTGVA